MDSNTLRLILFILGITLVVGIYLWDRKKHVDSKLFSKRSSRKSRTHDASVFDDTAIEKASKIDKASSVEELNTGDDFEISRVDSFQSQQDFSVDDGLSFSAKNAFEEYEAGTKLPTKIIQVNLLARKTDISGQMILDLTTELDMKLADFNIFHRLDPITGKSIFSMANIVEPGSFDMDAMQDFRTPGLTLFAQLPAPVDSMTVFTELMSAAKRIGYIVGAEMQDSSHCTLTSQSIEHQRNSVIDYHQKLQLAMQSL